MHLRDWLADWLPDGLDDPRAADLDIAGLTMDSRRVGAGEAFIALKGAHHDGHDHALAAAKGGAAVIVAERPVAGVPVPVVVVPGLRGRIAALAARFFGDPSAHLSCVGITGTNGKTSVAHFVADASTRLGRAGAYAGTIGWGLLDELTGTDLTTADAVTVQRRLARLLAEGAFRVAMEVSSHALDQGRVDAVRFDIAAFTNLTRDHLDYHGDMRAYAAAKQRLFRVPSVTRAAVNVDDAVGREIAAEHGSRLTLITVGATADADVSWTDLDFHADGVRGTLLTPWGRLPFATPLYGEFNVANVALAVAVLALAGDPPARIVEVLSALRAPPGRMQQLRRADGAVAIVDYAHTPDALIKALSAARRHASGRLGCVFGCGGDRDRGKRPHMAAAAEQGADAIWLTSDNPRNEDPARIIDDARAGLTRPDAATVEADRARAIELAVAWLEPGDVLLVAGKGHERYQEIAGVRHPFDDADVLRRTLAEH